MENKELQHEEELKPTFAVHPKKFLLWLFIVTIVMMFAAMTSAYLVRSTDGDWLKFDLPNTFLVSTAVIILSSITLQGAYWAAQNNNRQMLIAGMGITVVLGVVFLVLQYEGLFIDLFKQGVFLGGEYSNPAGSFVYVLALLHGFHLVTGLIYLLIVFYSSVKGKVGSSDLLQIEMCTTYWHFLDLLWIYLFVFLQLNN
nr:cytochrome c oxidase subunit 3 [Cytophaga aurantiaca]